MMRAAPTKTVRPELVEGLSFLGAVQKNKGKASTSSARTDGEMVS